MESDRMGYLAPALTQAKFDNQRDVVLNERRQNYENRPYGFATMAIAAALLSGGSPVSLAHNRRVRRSEGRCAGRGARLLPDLLPPGKRVAGAGGRHRGRAGFSFAERYFGDLPPGPLVSRVVVPTPALAREQRLVLEDTVEFPRIYLAWHSPAMFEPGDADLDLLGDLLANGKTSRLYRELVFTRRIALDVAAYQNSREAGGFFLVVATAAPGYTLVEIEQAITAEIARVASEGRRPRNWSGAGPRRRRCSSIACRRWAGSAASRTSSTRTTSFSTIPASSTRPAALPVRRWRIRAARRGTIPGERLAGHPLRRAAWTIRARAAESLPTRPS